MKKITFLILLFIPCASFAYFDVGFNAFSAIYNFKPSGAFTTASFRHENKLKDKWDIGGGGFYINATFSHFDWVHLGLYLGKSSFSENIDEFNGHFEPIYKVSQFDYGVETKLFPFRGIFFVRLGILQSSSTHKLLSNTGENVPLFDFKGLGYQAGVGIQYDMEKGCLDYDCGFGIENLVRKAWATKITPKSNEVGYVENSAYKPNYRQVMICLNAYLTY